MSNEINERIELVNKIVSGKLSRADAEAELDHLQSRYGKDAFLPYSTTRKEKPWDMAYLHELHHTFVAGAASREYISYMAEVSEYVYRRERMKRVAIAAGVGIIAVAAIAVFALR